jgi:hypothetical protein
VLRLNPGDSADNVITFEGAFTATIVQSAAGMDITIPGVKFTLDCQGDPTESCTVTVGSATVSESVAPPETPSPSGSNPDPAGSNPDPAGNDDEDCVADGTNFGTVYGCNNDGSTGNSSPPAPDESVDDSPSEDTGSSGDGFDLPSSGDSGDEDTDSGGWTLNAPPAGSGSDDAERQPFPASGRENYISSPDLGSGGAQRGGNTFEVALGLQTVTVLPFTMAAENATGGVGLFQPSNSPTGSDLATWISASRDGGRVSANCSRVGGFDGKLRISTEDSATACVLQPGGSYFLNVAACVRGNAGDYDCRSNAQTGYKGGDVLLNSRW